MLTVETGSSNAILVPKLAFPNDSTPYKRGTSYLSEPAYTPMVIPEEDIVNNMVTAELAGDMPKV